MGFSTLVGSCRLTVDARYCKPSRRTLAYWIRKRTSSPAAKPNQVAPKWADGKPPVVGSALASLADLQARILTVAHQLQKEICTRARAYCALARVRAAYRRRADAATRIDCSSLPCISMTGMFIQLPSSITLFAINPTIAASPISIA